MKLIYPFSFLFVFSACSSAPTNTAQRNPTQTNFLVFKTRDEIMGVNRAKASVKARAGREYLLRNVASAFPDTGKNMLIKDTAVGKDQVRDAKDQSPFRQRIYGNTEHLKADQARFNILNKTFYPTALTQKEALAQTQMAKHKNEHEGLYQSGSFGIDDGMEPNNSFEKAFDMTDAEDQWIGRTSEGVQWEEDWYKIWVSPQYRHLILDLRYQNYLGDVDMRLYDERKAPLAISQGVVDDEYINVVLNQGGYYWVQVYGANRGNRYDFKFQTKFTGGGDDEYEDNDTLKKAFPLASFENQWLSKIKGEAVAADNDFYSIKIAPGKLRVVVDLRVEVEKSLVDQGDVDVKLLGADGRVIASSSNILDDDYIDFTVPTAGTYYLKVYPFNAAGKPNMYDLKWTTFKTVPVMASQKRAQNISASSQK